MKKLLICAGILLTLVKPALAQDQVPPPAQPTSAAASASPSPGPIPIPTPTPTKSATPAAELITLPDGRSAIAFEAGTSPPDIPGYDRITLPDGRIALAKAPHSDTMIPEWALHLIAQRKEPVTLTTGTVPSGQVIASVPYTYRRMFRLKTDRTFTSIFLVKMTAARSGSIGFYGGTYNTPTHDRAELLCLFPKNDKGALQYPNCYLQSAEPNSKLGSVKVNSNVPDSYYVITYNGVPTFSFNEPLFDKEDGVFPLDHDFRLNLTITKWTGNMAYVRWMSEGNLVKEETLSAGPNGKLTFPVNGGTLTLNLKPGDYTATESVFTPGPISGGPASGGPASGQ